MKYRSSPLLFLGLLSTFLAAACGGETEEAKANAAILSFLATPDHVQMGEAVELTWKTQDASSIEILDDEGNAVALGNADTAEGAVSVHPIEDTTYHLHAVGPSGKHATAEATVTVAMPAAAPRSPRSPRAPRAWARTAK